MSEQNVEIIRQLVEAFNEGRPTLSPFFADDAVFEEPPEQPAPRIARGREEIAEIFGAFDEAWTEHRSEPEEFTALDGGRVLMFSVEHFRGRDGIEVTHPGATIFTLRGGKVVRMQSFWDRDTALRAARE